MPRTVYITVPSAQAGGLLIDLQRIEGLIGLRHFPGASVKSPGDAISLDVTDRDLPEVMRLLEGAGVGRDPGTALVTSAPTGVVSSQFAERVARDRTEWTWEEMELEIGRQSNMTANGVLVMVVSGAVATIGVATGAIHLVIGAMVIAPGFEPLTRIALGVVARSRAWRRGLWDAAVAYVTLFLAAVGTALLLRLTGGPVLQGGGTYLPVGELVSYWATITPVSVAGSAVASVGGALLVAAGRAVLTGGVMIALALVPTVALAGMATVAGDWPLAGDAAARWLIDAGLVVVCSAAVMAWKRLSVHRRRAMP